MIRAAVRWGLAASTGSLLVGLPAAAQTSVAVKDSRYEPATVTVSVGETVTWTHQGSLPHSVTADDGSFDSHPNCPPTLFCMQSGDQFSHTFPTPGTFGYYCRVHGAAMRGTVVVQGAATPPPPPPPPTEPATEPPTTATTPTTAAPTTTAATESTIGGDETSTTGRPGTSSGPDTTSQEASPSRPLDADDEDSGTEQTVTGLVAALLVVAVGASVVKRLRDVPPWDSG